MRSRSNWNLEVAVFEERGKPEWLEKNLSEQGREPTTNWNHIRRLLCFFFNIIPIRSDWLSSCFFILQMWTQKSNYLSNLSAYCFRANLRVTPKRGTAIMWYNHIINQSTGWMSSLDSLSYHGGCDVIKGHKWIVNNWIDIIGDNWDDLRTWSGIHYRIDDMEQE